MQQNSKIHHTYYIILREFLNSHVLDSSVGTQLKRNLISIIDHLESRLCKCSLYIQIIEGQKITKFTVHKYLRIWAAAMMSVVEQSDDLVRRACDY